MNYIVLESIEKRFGKQHVLKDIHLELEKGEFASLLGPSGCGKSTLLRCIAGLETVTSGSICIDGIDVTTRSPKERAVGMVFQQYSLFPNMTVEQNVGFGLKMMHVPKQEIRERVRAILDTVALTGSEKKKPTQLSGGMQQRVALARALITRPKVLLLDEPLSAIDAKLRKDLQTEIRRIQKETNITTVFVTHDQSEAMLMSDTIHIMHEGVIEQSGCPSDIYVAPKTPFAAGFIGNYNLLSAAAFRKLSAAEIKGENVAIRPEVIGISQEKPDGDEDTICAQGVVVESFLHGNILSYQVQCGDCILKTDVLYRTVERFENNALVWLCFSGKDFVAL
ncbi:MAG: ABC transporter ATP-binding protein [Ethanoligenens sp.]